MRMLHNRNLDWLNSAKVLFRLSGIGPLAASTVGAIAHGREELSPELLTGFAAVLAISDRDLAALIGVEATHASSKVNPAAVDVAGLIWDVRHLSVGQVQQVCDEANSNRLHVEGWQEES
ncbi:hypothetical protein ACGFIG_14335 [Micromonospora sp. NPDC049048]|uniref:hypothetical protein n=1 Tax=Micromonospora sp. NPDC049048 TaxID=3364263 RepID=UPI0037229713